jgi:hypothetical protein
MICSLVVHVCNIHVHVPTQYNSNDAFLKFSDSYSILDSPTREKRDAVGKWTDTFTATVFNDMFVLKQNRNGGFGSSSSLNER